MVNSKAIELISLLFILIFVTLTVVLNNCGLLCISIGMSCIILSRGNDYFAKYISVFALMLMSAMVHVGINVFEFMPQANTLLQMDTSIIKWFSQGHFHAIRLLIAYPGYILSEIYSIELNLAYSYYCSLIFALFYYKVINIVSLRSKVSEGAFFLIFILVLVLFFAMNGRACFAFLGFSIVIFEVIEVYDNKAKKTQWPIRYFNIVIGIVLSTVSSGTMIVCVGYLFIMLVVLFIKKGKIEVQEIRFAFMCLILSPAIYLGIKYVFRMINKNITYFGGGVSGAINMLKHGMLGTIIPNYSDVLLMIVICVGTIILLINIFALIVIYHKNNKFIPVCLAANVAFYGLFFGVTTGSLIIIPIIVMVVEHFSFEQNDSIRNKSNWRRHCKVS